MHKENVLFSLCFTGEPCRYHGRSVPSPVKIARCSKKYKLIFVCPEQLGGLSVPRPAAPLQNKQNSTLYDITGRNVSSRFILGARKTLKIALKYNCQKAYLCKNSPSCDKTGFAGELLKANGIEVVNL